MSYTAAIFDLDGLIIDSEPVWHIVHPAFLKKHAISYDPKLQEKTLGRGIKDVIKLHKEEGGLTGDVDALALEFRGMFYDEFFSKEHFHAMPGAIDFVKKIKDAGYILGAATGGHDIAHLNQILERLGILACFTVAISSDMVEKGKPDPQVFLLTAKQLGVAPAACIVFEDSPNGVMAGKSAGMRVIGINPSGKMRSELTHIGADFVFPSFHEVDFDMVVKSGLTY